MNERFFTLPEQRQKDIINAGLYVFSQNEYAKAPTSQIAQAGQISKSLLFHYFTNKKELYLFLWNYAAQITTAQTQAYHALEAPDVFEMLLRTTQAKCRTMREYPYLFAFSMKAYYERNPEVAPEIQAFIVTASEHAKTAFTQIGAQSNLVDGVSAEELYRQFLMLSDGYMFQHYATGDIDPDIIETDFTRIIALWKSVFSKG